MIDLFLNSNRYEEIKKLPIGGGSYNELLLSIRRLKNKQFNDNNVIVLDNLSSGNLKNLPDQIDEEFVQQNFKNNRFATMDRKIECESINLNSLYVSSTGIVTAIAGSWIAAHMDDALSNFLFAVLLIVIAGRMLLQLRKQSEITPIGE